MESTEDATLALFRIGPSTIVGRIVALKVLFCNFTLHLVSYLKSRASDKLWRWQKYIAIILSGLKTWLNPRSPNFMLASVLIAALMLRRYRLRSVKAEIAYRRKFWSNLMKTALTYDEWAHAARMLEKYEGRKQDPDLYDEALVRAKVDDLQHRRLEGGVEDIVFALRADLVRNLGNMCNPELHKGRLQTPALIQEYINEVRYHLRAVVCDTDSDEFPLAEKVAFIHETRHAFGRTALLLSGGAALGAFHLGVVRTLIEHRLLPRVLAGASVGSIICSFAATRTWNELVTFFDDPMPPMAFFESMGSIFATAHRLLTKGAIAEIGMLQRKMRQLIGDLTFQEAYDLSGRVLGIPVCSMRRHEPPRMLNYLTSPHVVIWSAVTASCAFPGLFEAQELMAKDRQGRLVPYHGPFQLNADKPDLVGKRNWRDGSLESDLPMKELKELFNVNHYIVSQANPHIAPLLRLKEGVRHYGGDLAAKMAHLVEMEAKHRCNQALEMGLRFWGIAKLFAQDWEGDITIVMPATIAQFARIIQNPTPTELRKAVMQGRRSTWAKLSAISANCGIELMLDECVSDLNRRRKAAARAAAAGGAGVAVAAGDKGIGAGAGLGGGEGSSRSGAGGGRNGFGTKRIPSWNCLARESSWGSLDEDGVQDNALQNGPWAGNSFLHRRGSARASGGKAGGGGGAHDASSDSDSADTNLDASSWSWTRAGGPLMRTASAAKLAFLGGGGDDDGCGSEHDNSRHGPDRDGGGNGGHQGDEAAETPGSAAILLRHARAAASNGASAGDKSLSKRNKIWDRIHSPVSPAGPCSSSGPLGGADKPRPQPLSLNDNEHDSGSGNGGADEHEAEGRSFGHAMRGGLSRSPRGSTHLAKPLSLHDVSGGGGGSDSGGAGRGWMAAAAGGGDGAAHAAAAGGAGGGRKGHGMAGASVAGAETKAREEAAQKGEVEAEAGGGGRHRDVVDSSLEEGSCRGGHFAGCAVRSSGIKGRSNVLCTCSQRAGLLALWPTSAAAAGGRLHHLGASASTSALPGGRVGAPLRTTSVPAVVIPSEAEGDEPRVDSPHGAGSPRGQVAVSSLRALLHARARPAMTPLSADDGSGAGQAAVQQPGGGGPPLEEPFGSYMSRSSSMPEGPLSNGGGGSAAA